jgi:hypothetical protein
MSDSTSVTLQRSELDKSLPSSYQRPYARLRIRSNSIHDKDDETVVVSPKRQVQNLERQMRSGMIDLFSQWYNGKEGVDLQERVGGSTPFMGAWAFDTLANVSTLATAAVYVGAYAVIVGAEYHDVRQATRHNSDAPFIKQKRWSVTPCGVPTERKLEMLTRAAFGLCHNRPTFVRLSNDRAL